MKFIKRGISYFASQFYWYGVRSYQFGNTPVLKVSFINIRVFEKTQVHMR